MDKKSFLNLFPYEQIRPHQLEVLNKIYDNYDKYDNFIIQAPTGTGKSALAYTICNSKQKGMILTGTKLLQDQYIKEFPLLHCVKGKTSYKCLLDKYKDCSNGPCVHTGNEDANICKDCLYKQAIKQINADVTVITNYSCLINNHSIKTRKNDVVIFDEAHTLEDALVEVQAFSIDKQKLLERYELDEFIEELEDPLLASMVFTGLGFSDNEKTIEYNDKKYPRNIFILYIIEKLLAKKWNSLLTFDEYSDEELKIQEEITKLRSKLKSYLDTYRNSNWIVNIVNKNSITIQPLNVAKLFNNLTKNCKKKIFMSATIISVQDFIDTFNLDPKKTAYIEVKETFNPSYAPIISYPVGRMGYKDIDKTIPSIIKAIQDILEIHKNEKGLILTNNYRITESIINQVKTNRFIHKYEKSYYYLTNEEMYQKHIKSKKPTVLISPSMNTGVDLPDDQSRFQIIVKLPYDNLGDKRIAYKAKTDRNWYMTRMIRSFIQSCGRSVRNENDWAVTYVLDSSFLYTINENKDKLTDTFRSRIFYQCDFNLQEFYQHIN